MQFNAEPDAGRRPTRFDALKLAASGESLLGVVDAADLPRVADRLATAAGPAKVEWQLVGGSDAQRRPMVTLTLKGSVPVVCQRCLQPMAARVDQTTQLLLARNEAELVRLDAEDVEVILASERLDPLALVEDELLLSLPFSPRHSEGECEAAVPATPGQEGVSGKAARFAPLEALKKTRS
jgi:uncharacterized protein